MSPYTTEKIIEIANSIKKWKIEGTLPQGSFGYVGDLVDYRIVVVAFDIEPQGFPKGTFGYDGTIVLFRAPLIQRFTREQAEVVFKIASKTLV